jgi:ABC-type sugar transport system permease subunit/ABC-type glycerol-3-phosphate transport system substrate-binding protein
MFLIKRVFNGEELRRRLLSAVLLFAAAFLTTPLRADITLRLATWEGAEALDIQRAAIMEFERLHPGVFVKLNQVDNGLYMQKMLTQYAANAAPDVAMMGFEKFQPLARRGVLMPLDDLAAHTPGFSLNEYYPAIVNVHRYQGRLYVLPRDIAPMGFVYYNKRLFDQAHMPYPDGSWTWDFQERPELKQKDFLWVLHHMTVFDSSGAVSQWAYSPGWPDLLAQSFVYSSGYKFLDDEANPTKVLYSDPNIVRCYKLEADLMLAKKWIPSPTEISSVLQSNSTKLFTEQKIAMMQGGIWEVPNIRKAIIPGTPGFFDWDITLFPAYKNGVRSFPSGGSGYCIFSSTSHPKEAWELLQFLAGPYTMKMVAADGLAQPAIRRLALSEPWQVGPDTPLAMRYPASRQLTDAAVNYVHFPPSSEYWPDLQTYINPRLDLIWSGEQTPEAALAQANTDAQTHLDRLKSMSALPNFNWTGGLVGALAITVGLVAFVYWPERGVKYSERQRQDNAAAYKFIAPWLVGAVLLILGPMIFSFVMSLSDWDIITPAKWRGMANYHEAIFDDPRFYVSLRVTLIYTLFSVPIGIIGSLLLATLLNTKVKGMPLFRTLFYLPSLASTVAAVLIWKKLFQPEGGLINMIIYGADGKGNFLGLAHMMQPLTDNGGQVNWLGSDKTALAAMIIMSLWGIGGGMVVLLAGLQGIPEYYYEAAMLDGASAWQKFKAVTVPLLTPSLFFVLVTGVIGSFQVFTQTFVMTQGGPGDATRFYMLYLYDQAFTSLRMGYASALAWLLFLIIAIATFLQFKVNKWVHSEGV